MFSSASYEFFAKRQLVTLFSAPNYCGEFDNSGSLMSVGEFDSAIVLVSFCFVSDRLFVCSTDETLMCRFSSSALFVFVC